MSGAEPAVAGLLLAAGAGRRMGGPKALIELDGEPLVRRGIRLLADGGCDPVVVAVGASAEQVRPLCTGARVVEAADWETGMGASLRAGLAALPTVAACVVALVDQPRVTALAVQRLRAAHDAGAVAAVATYAGERRNPVLLDRSTWPGVTAVATGDEGARGWLRAHPELVVEVDCTDAGAPDDLDTPKDLAALEAAAMKLENRLPVSIGEAWKGPLDLQRIAPCRPGAPVQKLLAPFLGGLAVLALLVRRLSR